MNEDAHFMVIGRLYFSLCVREQQLEKFKSIITSNEAEIDRLKAECPCEEPSEKNGETMADDKVGMTG